MGIVLDFGERRHIQFLIHSCKDENFQIADCDYELKKYGASEPEDSGSGNALDHMIDIVIEPKERGKYQLKVTYRIVDEILIETVGVDVI